MLIDLLKNLAGSPVIQAFLLGLVFVAIGFVVKKTKNKKDDAIFAAIRAAAFNAFNIAEKVIPDATGNKTLAKIDTALKVFNDRVIEKLNRNANASEFELAKDMWDEMAFEIKKK